jgi:hypothetical protein
MWRHLAEDVAYGGLHQCTPVNSQIKKKENTENPKKKKRSAS